MNEWMNKQTNKYIPTVLIIILPLMFNNINIIVTLKKK